MIIAPLFAYLANVFTKATPNSYCEYGGSRNTISAVDAYFDITLNASACITDARSPISNNAKLSRTVFIDEFKTSVNSNVAFEYLDRHSIPNAPLPANASQIVIFAYGSTMPDSNILNNAIRARFCVGRAPAGKFSFRPLYCPEIICNLEFIR